MNIGIAALAASGVFSGGTLPATADRSKGGDGRYVLPVNFGLGGVPLGNEFEVVSDQDTMFRRGTGLGLRNGVMATSSTIRTATITSCPRKLLKASPHNNAKSNFPFGKILYRHNVGGPIARGIVS